MKFEHMLAAGALATTALSAQAINPYYSTAEGAIKGYDPVAYFAEGKAVKGERQFSFTWQKAEWHFASAANLKAFQADPEKYAPQFGGYCAYGVSQGYAPATDPTAYTIADGKLYLNYNHKVSDKWNGDRDAYIVQGTQNWPALKAGDKTWD
ncbi:MAG: YHS domain-containing (seleno)protein [Pseudomonadota bacterium]